MERARQNSAARSGNGISRPRGTRTISSRRAVLRAPTTERTKRATVSSFLLSHRLSHRPMLFQHDQEDLWPAQLDIRAVKLTLKPHALACVPWIGDSGTQKNRHGILANLPRVQEVIGLVAHWNPS